jgi:hypothetical protein
MEATTIGKSEPQAFNDMDHAGFLVMRRALVPAYV